LIETQKAQRLEIAENYGEEIKPKKK
jgi:hypothetical protein